MNIYLDDIRCGPSNDFYGPINSGWQEWVIVRSIENAKILLELGLVNDMSLDHDLSAEETGYDLCKWMGETGHWPKGDISVHSANPVGARSMAGYIDRYKPQHIDGESNE